VDPVPDPLLFCLVVPGIEPGPPDRQPRTLTTRPQRRSVGNMQNKKNAINEVLSSIVIYIRLGLFADRLCGLVVRVLDYRYRGSGFDSRALQKKSNGSGTGSTQPRQYN
jgi:hypothetical protein